jgi:hypothetical protein
MDNYKATVWFVIRDAREDGTPLEASQALDIVSALDLAEQWTNNPYDWEGDLIPSNAGISLHHHCMDALVWLYYMPKKGWVFLCGGKRGHTSANDFVAELRRSAS